MQSIQGRGAGTITRRERREARFRKHVHQSQNSDDFKGTCVCFFAVMFHEFWERNLIFTVFPFFPGILHL